MEEHLERLRGWLHRLGEQDFTLPDLGIQTGPQGTAARRLVTRLEGAVAPDFLTGVQHNVATKAGASERHWRNLLFELKRFLLVAALLQDAPAWSLGVARVWRVLAAAVGDRFMRTLPVPPSLPETSAEARVDPQSRGLFDLVYLNLFMATPFSGHAWGPFLHAPLPQIWCERPETDLAARFSLGSATDVDLRDVAQGIIRRVRVATDAVRRIVVDNGGDPGGFADAFLPSDEASWTDVDRLTRRLVFVSLYGHEIREHAGRTGAPDPLREAELRGYETGQEMALVVTMM